MEKLIRVFAVAFVAFSIMLAGFIGARVDAFTITLLGGAFLGLMVAVPTTLVTMLLINRKQGVTFNDTQWRYSAPLPQSPPQYWVMPQPVAQPMPMMNPQLTNPNMAWSTGMDMPRRRFYVIGEAGDVNEVQAIDPEPAFTVAQPQMLGVPRLG
jgi:hypothetical protein